MTAKEELTLPAEFSTETHFTYQKEDESETGEPAHLTTPEKADPHGKENDPTKAQKLLSGFLFNFYLLCLIIYPQLHHIF